MVGIQLNKVVMGGDMVPILAAPQLF